MWHARLQPVREEDPAITHGVVVSVRDVSDAAAAKRCFIHLRGVGSETLTDVSPRSFLAKNSSVATVDME